MSGQNNHFGSLADAELHKLMEKYELPVHAEKKKLSMNGILGFFKSSFERNLSSHLSPLFNLLVPTLECVQVLQTWFYLLNSTHFIPVTDRCAKTCRDLCPIIVLHPPIIRKQPK